ERWRRRGSWLSDLGFVSVFARLRFPFRRQAYDRGMGWQPVRRGWQRWHRSGVISTNPYPAVFLLILLVVFPPVAVAELVAQDYGKGVSSFLDYLISRNEHPALRPVGQASAAGYANAFSLTYP